MCWPLLLIEDGKAEGLIYLTFSLALLKTRKRKRKRIWCKSWLLKRDIYFDLNHLNKLITTAKSYYQNCLRMDEET
jgi:hypothetical protein